MKSLFHNSAAMLAARLTAPALSFAINVGIARLCGPEVLGAYIHLIALMAIFQTAAGAGMAGLLTRELAAHPEDAVEQIRGARTLGILTGVVSTAGFLAAARLAAPSQMLAAAILSTSILPSAWITVHEAFFMATHTHHRITLISVAENGLKLCLAFLTFRVGGGLALLCAGVAVARAFGLLAGAVLLSRAGMTGTWKTTAWPYVRAFAVQVLPFAALLVLSTTYFKLDVLLVDALLGPGPTGIYGTALALYSVALLLPDSLMAAVYPRLSARHRESAQGYAEATLISVRLVTAVLVPVSLGLICFGDVFLHWIYGGRYAAAGPVLKLLAASLPLHAVNGALGQALLAGRLQGSMVRVVLVGLGVHAALCTFLLPRMGLDGAALSLVISATAAALGAAWVFHRRVAPLVDLKRVLFPVALVGGGIGVTLLVPGPWMYVAAAAGLAMAAGGPHALLKVADWKRVGLG